jgi:hypothetical protein
MNKNDLGSLEVISHVWAKKKNVLGKLKNYRYSSSRQGSIEKFAKSVFYVFLERVSSCMNLCKGSYCFFYCSNLTQMAGPCPCQVSATSRFQVVKIKLWLEGLIKDFILSSHSPSGAGNCGWTWITSSFMSSYKWH